MTAPAAVALPDRARVVVIGGGVIGTSVAYHLAHLGFGEVLLLERDRLTSGATWHAAGLMATFGSPSQTSTELRKYTWDLYSRLEAETGLATGLKQCGLIELAIEPGRLEEYRRGGGVQRPGGGGGVAGGGGRPAGGAAWRCTRSRRARSPRCSRWPGSTTCWPASTSRPTAGST